MWYKVGLITALIAVVTLPVGMLALLFVGLEAALTVFIVGWLLLVPVLPLGAAIYSVLSDSEAESVDNESEALTELKRRYAAGELDEEEFARRVDKLLELEGITRAQVDDVVDFEDGDAVPASGGMHRESAPERERN